MVLHNKGLGRGLDALFQGGNAGRAGNGGKDSPFTLVPVAALVPNPSQPRSIFSEERLDELADSIKSQGIIQPLIVRPHGEEGLYEIIAGERRWRAARKAGLPEVPVLVKNFDDREAMIAALIENIQREDLNPLEQARGMQALKTALGASQESMADMLGMARGTVGNIMRLLNLDEETSEALLEGKITAGHARCILGVPAGDIARELRERIISQGLSVREAEAALDFWRKENHFPWNNEADNGQKSRQKPDSDIVLLARQIGAQLHCRTQIRGNSEKGRISLAYESNAQLYELLEKLGLSLTSLG